MSGGSGGCDSNTLRLQPNGGAQCFVCGFEIEKETLEQALLEMRPEERRAFQAILTASVES